MEHMNGPAMIIAGPGAGKTNVIINRIRFLISRGVRPESILVITFTRAAAQQMRRRFEALAAPEVFHVTFGTFHAVFFQILKNAYHYSGENILREDERFRILSSIASTMNVECEDMREWTADIAAEISKVKSDNVPVDCYYSANCPEEDFRKIYRMYTEQLQRMKRIDFDDMMIFTADLFHSRKDILESWQRHFRYILVDEFQDINYMQYKIVRQMALPDNNLFIVGDDDQSIYRFRGSRPEIMLNFPKDYPDAKVLLLTENFRSDASIVRSSLKVIDENKGRFRKELFSSHEDGEPVEVIFCHDVNTEMEYLTGCIRRSLKNGVEPSEIAVLTRTNLEAREPSRRLMEYSIPFSVKDSVPLIYDHWIAQDIFACLRMRTGIMERKDFLRVCNRPNRYISRESVDAARWMSDGRVCVSWTGLRAFYSDKDWMLERIERFESDMRMMMKMRPFAAINYIRYAMGYDEFLKDYANKRRIDLDELRALEDEFQYSSRDFDSMEAWLKDIDRYRMKMEEQRGGQAAGDIKNDCVTLSTLHSAKGLEFAEVFMINVNEQIIPYKKASLEADIEEERRLFYVGMTRAKKKLHILYLDERYNKKLKPSRFLDALREKGKGN